MAAKHPDETPGELSGEVAELEERSTTAARLFDLRRIIGGLFVLYGVIVTLAGLTDGDTEIDKAQGININLWTGVGMLALGVFFLGWMWVRPVKPPVEAQSASSEDGVGKG